MNEQDKSRLRRAVRETEKRPYKQLPPTKHSPGGVWQMFKLAGILYAGGTANGYPTWKESGWKADITATPVPIEAWGFPAGTHLNIDTRILCYKSGDTWLGVAPETCPVPD